MHLVKNMLMDRGVFDAQIRVPLLLGVWGGKGQGKTFQTELALKKLGCAARPRWACWGLGVDVSDACRACAKVEGKQAAS